MTPYEAGQKERGSPSVNWVGDGALLFEAGVPACLESQSRIWALADRVSDWPVVREAVIGVSSLLLIVDALAVRPDPLQSALLEAWRDSLPRAPTGHTVEIAVTYGGEAGADLPEVARVLGMSEREVIELHQGAEYHVFASGSSPGFAYLGGLPPALTIPRRAVPILRAEAGSLLLGGNQTGVTANPGPTGWYVLGCTALRMFDPHACPPVQLQPGDRVVFRELERAC